MERRPIAGQIEAAMRAIYVSSTGCIAAGFIDDATQRPQPAREASTGG